VDNHTRLFSFPYFPDTCLHYGTLVNMIRLVLRTYLPSWTTIPDISPFHISLAPTCLH
jgi:hypothetical protein